MTERLVLRTPSQGRTLAVVGDVYRFLAAGEDTNGKYAVWGVIVPPGGDPPPHVHSREEEGFYVKWTPNTGPLDRGVFVKALPHFNRGQATILDQVGHGLHESIAKAMSARSPAPSEDALGSFLNGPRHARGRE